MSQDLHPSVQILTRNLEQLQGKLLIINPVEASAISAILTTSPVKKVTVSCQDYGLYLDVKKTGVASAFETHCKRSSAFDMAVLFLPKSDAEISMTLAWASETLKPNGKIVLIGQNNAGIKSAKKTLEKLIGPVVFSDSARHSAFYVATKTIKLNKFNLADYWQKYEVTLPTTHSELNTKHLIVYSLPGTFSHGRLDDGTKLFLDSLETLPEAKHILDWGCGAGTIGALIATTNKQAKIDLIDTNALALESAKKTIEQNKLSNCNVLAGHVFTGTTNMYDYIVANPPFHKGHDTYYADVEKFLLEAKNHLTEHGRLRIVANIFLRYEQLMEQQFGYVKTIAKTNKYKILEAVKVAPQLPGKFKKHRKMKMPENDNLDDYV